MVILAVNVSGNRAAKRNEAGAGSDRRKKPRGRKTSINSAIVTPASHRSSPLAASKESIRLSRVRSTTRFRSLSAASPYARPAPRAISEDELRSHNRLQLRDFIRPIDIALGERITAPPGEQSMPRIRRRRRSACHSEKNATALKLTGSTRSRNASSSLYHFKQGRSPASFFFIISGAGVTPAEGSVKPTAGFTFNQCFRRTLL